MRLAVDRAASPQTVTLASSDVTARLVRLDAGGEWTAALAGLRQAFNHSHAANRAFALSTGIDVRLLVCESARFRLACPLAMRAYAGETDVFTPPGFSGFAVSGEVDGFDQLWQGVGRNFGWVCAYVQAHPALPDPCPPAEVADARVAYVLDLSQPPSELLARMSQSRRRQLRRPLPPLSDIRIVKVGAAAFLSRESPAFFSARNAAKLMHLCPEAWDTLLDSPQTVAVAARIDGEIQAVSLFGLADGVADYLYNVSTSQGQDWSANLIWEAIPALQAAGARSLNLGGGIRADDAIAEFKRRFGPAELPIRPLRTIFDPQRYRQLVSASRVPTDTAFFPAYHLPTQD